MDVCFPVGNHALPGALHASGPPLFTCEWGVTFPRCGPKQGGQAYTASSGKGKDPLLA